MSNQEKKDNDEIDEGFIKYVNIIDENRIYIVIPPYEKDRVKHYGGKWDYEKKCWYYEKDNVNKNILKDINDNQLNYFQTKFFDGVYNENVNCNVKYKYKYKCVKCNGFIFTDKLTSYDTYNHFKKCKKNVKIS